jgi:hypothetical protein
MRGLESPGEEESKKIKKSQMDDSWRTHGDTRIAVVNLAVTLLPERLNTGYGKAASRCEKAEIVQTASQGIFDGAGVSARAGTCGI